MAVRSAASSTSIAPLSKSYIPSQKQMIRTTSEKFKSSSNLLNDAIKVHEEREKELLSTIQKLSEQIKKQQTALEELEGKHQKEHLIDQRKIRELKSGIANVSSEFKTNFEDIKKICQKLIRRPEQYRMCYSAIWAYNLSKKDNMCTLKTGYASGLIPSAYVEFMKAKLDDEYKDRVYLPHGLSLFDLDTESDAKCIQRKLEMVSKECEALEEKSKNMPQA